MAGYVPPLFTEPVVLDIGYTPPALSVAVVLCDEDDGFINGTMLGGLPTPALDLDAMASFQHGHATHVVAPLPHPDLSFTFAATEIPPRVGETLWAKLPLMRPADPTIGASGDRVVTVATQATLALPPLELKFHARESSHDAVLDVAIAPPAHDFTLSVQGDRVHDPHLAADLPVAPLSMTVAIVGVQDLDLPDAIGPSVSSRHAEGVDRLSALAIPQQHGRAVRRAARCFEETARQITVPVAMREAQMRALRRHASFSHAQGNPIIAGFTAPHAETDRTRRSTEWRHQHADRLRAGVRVPHDDTIVRKTRRAARHQHALPSSKPLAEGSHNARRAIARLHVRWQQAQYPDPGRWWPFYETPPLTIVIDCAPYTPRPLSCPVLLGAGVVVQPPCPDVDPGQPGVTIPVLEAYVVINTFSLVRVSDDLEIEAADFSASLDRDSWCWSWSARIPASALSQIEPEEPGSPREFIATLNGTPLRLLAEGIRRDRRHASSWLTVSGRGRAAWLADPYAPVEDRYNTELRTAQQLLADALTVNGVPLGWDIDWQLEDWNVPTGAFSHNGTYIAAALRIAEAGGGYVQSHDTDDTLIVLPHYPVAPWDWDGEVADLALPEDACEVEGIEWVEKAPYNAVYVVGGDGGRKDLIRRGGTAADRPAPTIVDQLATATAMTRQRGLAILGDTGRQAHISVRLPVLPEAGIIKPGLLVDYTENGTTRRGLSRAVSVAHTYPEIWQTVRIETHDHQPV